MASSLPPLPKIEGDVDLVLDVYTHKSLRPEGVQLNDDYGDTDRLAELGGRILELAVTLHYYSKKPMLKAAEMAELRNRALSNENLEAWLDAYGLRHKLRFAPGEKDAVGTPEELRRFFDTYVGALHIRNGMATIQDWISRLIDPDAEPTSLQFQIPNIDILPHPLQTFRPPPPPSQPPSSHPPLPPNDSPSTGMGVPSMVTLALVNQTAVQRGIAVTYSGEQVGPPHLPTWTVRCCMNGVEQGCGTGKSQKQAKEEAARQAWARMGW